MKLGEYLNNIYKDKKACDQLTEEYTAGSAREYLTSKGVELDDEELRTLSAGENTHRVWVKTENYCQKHYIDYEWKGTDENKKYLCPNCSNPVRPVWGWRYHCDACDENWFIEGSLKINPDGGWVEKERGVQNCLMDGVL